MHWWAAVTVAVMRLPSPPPRLPAGASPSLAYKAALPSPALGGWRTTLFLRSPPLKKFAVFVAGNGELCRVQRWGPGRGPNEGSQDCPPVAHHSTARVLTASSVPWPWCVQRVVCWADHLSSQQVEQVVPWANKQTICSILLDKQSTRLLVGFQGHCATRRF